MQKTFPTPTPTELLVELGSGDLTVRCEEVDQTTVDVDGQRPDEVLVEQRGDQIVVIGPKHSGGLFGGHGRVSVRVTLPSASSLSTKLGSADVTCTGRLGDTRIKTGSGDVSLELVDGEALVETGSGDLRIDEVEGQLRTKSGSGEVSVGRVDGPVTVSTGSGDTEVGTASGAVVIRSGSGDLTVRRAGGDVSLTTASGDLVVETMARGRLQAKNVSGDVRIGIPRGVPVWTDLSTVTGRVHSSLEGAGQPAEGQDHVELRATTVSGDIALEQR